MIHSKTSSLSSPTSTGNQSVTGLGFSPKIVFFWLTNLSADGSAANGDINFGVAVSSSNRRSTAATYQNTASTNFNAAGHDNSKCIYKLSSAAAVVIAADLVSMDTDGFTLNWTTANATQYKVMYLALGGEDLTNVTTGQFTRPTVTGNQATTGIGFKPDSVILFNFRDTTSAPPANSSSTSPRPRFGFGTTSGQAQTSTRMDAGIGSRGYQRTSTIFSAIDDATNNQLAEASLVSLDSDGFTLNWTTVDANARYVFYIALKGGNFSIGSFNQPTSNGSQQINSVGFLPSTVILSSRDLVSSTSIDAPGKFSMGVGTGPNNRFSVWCGESDSITANDAGTNLDTTKIIKIFSPGGAAPTLNAAADLTGFNPGGFTLNWTTTDATAREVIYFAIGDKYQGQYMF